MPLTPSERLELLEEAVAKLWAVYNARYRESADMPEDTEFSPITLLTSARKALESLRGKKPWVKRPVAILPPGPP
jgi:hypothetical protein